MSVGAQLLDSLARAEATLWSLRHANALPAPNLPQLEKAEKDLAAIRSCRLPVGNERYLAMWQRYLDGGGPAPSGRALACLCWHPGTALSLEFQQYLSARRDGIPGRGVEGLIWCCLMHWDRARRAGALSIARRQLTAYSGRRRRLLLWRSRPEITAEDGPVTLGPELALRHRDLAGATTDLGIEPNCEFFRRAVAEAAASCRRASDADAQWRYCTRDLLKWNGWPPADFRHQFQDCVLWAHERLPDRLPDLAKLARKDSRLGDPRQPRNSTNWAGIPQGKRLIIACLSRFDVEFFFSHVLPNKRTDPHRRKEFWLQYLPQLRASRPVLCLADRNLESLMLADAGNLGNVHTSAFILDFGNVLCIEFSKTGNACYIYGHLEASSVVPDIWAPRFALLDLKQKRRAAKTVTHRAGWQEEASQTLASYGIRP